MRRSALIIDDDDLVIQVVDLVLTQAGFSVTSARSGELGLASLAHSRPSIVLLDIQMPDMTGLNVLNMLRKHRKSNVPVMMMTARGDVDTVKQALAEGANGYLVKPFTPAMLLARVDAVLNPPAQRPKPAPSRPRPPLELD